MGWAGVGCGFLCWLFVPGPECPPPAWASCPVLFPCAPHPPFPLPPEGGSSQGLGSGLWGHPTAKACLRPKAWPHWHWLREPSEVTSSLSRQCHLSCSLQKGQWAPEWAEPPPSLQKHLVQRPQTGVVWDSEFPRHCRVGVGWHYPGAAGGVRWFVNQTEIVDRHGLLWQEVGRGREVGRAARNQG